MKPLEQTALEHLITNLLQADKEWLVQNAPNNYSYWQNTLEAHLSAEANEDGSIKLRAESIVVKDIEDRELAERVCASLNYLAPSWSFAYDYEEQTIKALSSLNLFIHKSGEAPTRNVVEPEPFQNAWLTIFANTIWAQNTLSADLAEQISQAINGKPAFSKPAHQPNFRETPDTFNHIPNALRQRPEWVMDIRPYTQWPSFADIAEQVALIGNEEMFNGTEWEVAESSDESALLSNTDDSGLVGTLGLSHAQDFRYGETFSIVHPVNRPPVFSDFELGNKANLQMFESGTTTQFGNWRFSNGSFAFSQNIPAAFIRTIESSAGAAALANYSPVFFARLAKFTLDLEDLLSDLQRGKPRPQKSDNPEGIQEQAHAFIQSIQETSTEARNHFSSSYDDATSDPRILRGESLYNFFTIGIFNPIGPTIHSLEAFAGGGSDLILVDVMRHSLYPAYLPIAQFSPSSPDLITLFESSIDRMFNHIPEYIYMDDCPEQIRPALDDLIKEKLLKLAHEQNVDVAGKLARLIELNQSPWQRVDHDLEPIPDATKSATKDQVEELFAFITAPENIILFWNHIPDAWDGSLNSASRTGFIDDTSVGPLVWTYNGYLGITQ